VTPPLALADWDVSTNTPPLPVWMLPFRQQLLAMGMGALPVQRLATFATCDEWPWQTSLATRETEGLSQTEVITQVITQVITPVTAPVMAPVTANVQALLHSLLPGSIKTLLVELQSIINRLQVQGYVIGGIPRDLLLASDCGLDIQDVDITLEGYAPDLIDDWLELSDNFTCQAVYPEYGTATLLYKGSITVDVASTRQETYTTPGAMPTVVNMGVPLAQDLLRRDFTINTLALSLNRLGTLVDALGLGLEDLSAGRLRALSPVSFYEDPTRMLRACRFASRFNFTLSPATLQMAQDWWLEGPLFYHGGGERVAVELRRLLVAWSRPERDVPLTEAMALCRDIQALGLIDTHMQGLQPLPLGVLEQLAQHIQLIYADLYHWPQMTQTLLNDTVYQVWLCCLSAEMADPLHTVTRLGLDKSYRQAVKHYCAIRDGVADDEHPTRKPLALYGVLWHIANTSDAYDRFKGKPLATLLALWISQWLSQYPATRQAPTEKRYADQSSVKLSGSDTTEALTDARDAEMLYPVLANTGYNADNTRLPDKDTYTGLQCLQKFWMETRHTQSLLDGDELHQLGVEKGEAIGVMKHRLVLAQLSGLVTDADSARGFVEDRMPSQQPSS
jgi:hypothetical protein